MKFNISMDDELVVRMEKYAQDNYFSRSGFISFCVNQYLNAVEMNEAIQKMSVAMQTIAEKNELDEETIKQLEDFERLAKILSFKK